MLSVVTARLLLLLHGTSLGERVGQASGYRPQLLRAQLCAYGVIHVPAHVISQLSPGY